MSGYGGMKHWDWIEGNTGQTCSDFGRKAAYIIGVVFGGIYNAPIDHDKTDWTNQFSIEVVLTFPKSLSTWDSNSLTTIVLLAHEMCVRADVSSQLIAGYWDDDNEESIEKYVRDQDDAPDADWYQPTLKISLHLRNQRDGGIATRHPTIDDAVSDFRSWFDKFHPTVFDNIGGMNAALEITNSPQEKE